MRSILTYWGLAGTMIGLTALAGREVYLRIVERVGRDLAVPDDADAEKYDAAAGERWLEDARKTARSLAETGDVSADDIWKVCPPPKAVDGRLLSRVFDRSEWEIVGYRHSDRGRNSARKIAVWKRKKIAEAA
jgi:hypothetical protein